MPVSRDLTGQKFFRWTAISRDPLQKRKWLCRCECGTEKIIAGYSITGGTSQSCGCYSDEIKRSGAHHRMTGTRFWISWRCMKERCQYPKNPKWKDYGGRGIRVCAQWEDFDQFLSDMYPTYEDHLTLERIDNDGNYEPGNCRWATIYDQQQNRRDCIYVTVPSGERKTVSAAAREVGLSRHVLMRRVRAGCPASLLFGPVERKRGPRGPYKPRLPRPAA